MRALLHSKDFWAVSGLNTALFFSGAGGRATLLPLLAVQDFGYSPAGLGAIFTAMAATSLLGVGPAAAIGDKYGGGWCKLFVRLTHELESTPGFKQLQGF